MAVVRRVVVGVPIVLAVVALVYALKPFAVTGGTLTNASGRRFVALPSALSCGAPIVDAWHGKGLPVGTKLAIPDIPHSAIGPPAAVGAASFRVPTCRGEAKHRLLVAVLFLTASVALGGLAFVSRRRLGFGPDPSPAQ